MNETVMVQGRRLTAADILSIRQLIADNPDWSRRRLSEVLSAEWDWRNGSGRLKDMAARTLLVKLDARGLIELPARRRAPSNRMALRQAPRQIWDSTPVTGTLRDLGPLNLREISADGAAKIRFAAALAEFHYLGFRGTVGENLQYTVTDAKRPAAGLPAVWLCGLEVSSEGPVHRLDAGTTGAESAPGDQQHPLSDSALCTGSTSCELDPGSGAASAFGGLAKEVRSPNRPGRNLC